MASQRPAKRVCTSCARNGGASGETVPEDDVASELRPIRAKLQEEMMQLHARIGLLQRRVARLQRAPGATKHNVPTPGPIQKMRDMESELLAAIRTNDTAYRKGVLQTTRERWQKEWKEWWEWAQKNVTSGYEVYVAQAKGTWETELAVFSRRTGTRLYYSDREANLQQAFGPWLAQWSQWWEKDETQDALPGLALPDAAHELRQRKGEEEQVVKYLISLGAQHREEREAAARLELQQSGQEPPRGP
eukprot:g50103.t1